MERQQGEPIPQNERSPIYKIREADEGTYIELLSLGIEGGRLFPLDAKLRTEGGTVMCSEEHPIELVAPDGTQYRHTQA